MTKAKTPAQELARLRKQKADQMARYRAKRVTLMLETAEIKLLNDVLTRHAAANPSVDFGKLLVKVRSAKIRG